jgi:phage shock protein C
MNDKRLIRSSDNRIVAGVAAGIAEYLGTDPTLVRVIFVLMGLLGGHGVLVYGILWFLMPKN